MSAIFSLTDAEVLKRPHVVEGWFGDFEFPGGTRYLHNGVGHFTIGGNEYRGISDPVGGRLVSIGPIAEPQFGQAASVSITLSGVTSSFIQEVYETRYDTEGRSARLYNVYFDCETQQAITGLIPIFPFGRMSAPSFRRQGLGSASVTFTVESLYQQKNFAPGGMWNDASQQRRFAGDRFFQFATQPINEDWGLPT